MVPEKELLCYNRGCGQKYVEQNNTDDSCLHHPGPPFFHDAYKGWSCCKKKCTDFTEFLNIKGCTKSKHTNIKPKDPENMNKNVSMEASQENKAPEPLKPQLMIARPAWDSPLIKLKTAISSSLQQELQKVKPRDASPIKSNNSISKIEAGTTCKNGGCKEAYVNESSNDTECCYHPGVPIFHEGLKYWTCCTKRTTDFQAFLDQEGCMKGRHMWMKKDFKASSSACRYDWMQTGTHVIVNVYCKNYDPQDACQTFIEVNPIRLRVRIFFPDGRTFYDNDLELRGVIDPLASSVLFTPTKVEISLRKAEPMSWSRLDVPRPVNTSETVVGEKNDALPKVDALDLSDL